MVMRLWLTFWPTVYISETCERSEINDRTVPCFALPHFSVDSTPKITTDHSCGQKERAAFESPCRHKCLIDTTVVHGCPKWHAWNMGRGHG